MGYRGTKEVKWTWSNLIDQVHLHCVVDPSSGCWMWQRARDKNGYGKFCVAGRHMRVARAVLMVSSGEDHPGEVTRHTCDNPPCCNPAHLLWGTHRDNKIDSIERGRAALSNFHVKRGETNGRSKLTDLQRREIRDRKFAGERTVDLAAEFEVKRWTIWQTCKEDQ